MTLASDFRTWIECSRLLDADLHRHVADLAVRHGIDLRLVPRRRGWWTRLYDLELHNGTREQWAAVMVYVRRMR